MLTRLACQPLPKGARELKPDSKYSERVPDIAAQATYASLADGPDSSVTRAAIDAILVQSGVRLDDPRLASLSMFLWNGSVTEAVSIEEIAPAILGLNTSLISRSLRGKIAIPDFVPFRQPLTSIFGSVSKSRGGNVASYIPQLARVNLDTFAMAVCTIDGLQFSIGDIDNSYRIQSTCKPINYAIAHDQLGADAVHQHVGREPSGRSLSEMTLNASSTETFVYDAMHLCGASANGDINELRVS